MKTYDLTNHRPVTCEQVLKDHAKRRAQVELDEYVGRLGTLVVIAACVAFAGFVLTMIFI